MELIKSNNMITQAELSSKIGISPKNIRNNIDFLKQNGLIVRVGTRKNGHWEVMNETESMPHFDNPNSFVTFLANSKIEKIPSEDSVNNKCNVISGKFPNWTYTDTKDAIEMSRRENIARRFVKLYRGNIT
jgi:hypothetical protein